MHSWPWWTKLPPHCTYFNSSFWDQSRGFSRKSCTTANFSCIIRVILKNHCNIKTFAGSPLQQGLNGGEALHLYISNWVLIGRTWWEHTHKHTHLVEALQHNQALPHSGLIIYRPWFWAMSAGPCCPTAQRLLIISHNSGKLMGWRPTLRSLVLSYLIRNRPWHVKGRQLPLVTCWGS